MKLILLVALSLAGFDTLLDRERQACEAQAPAGSPYERLVFITGCIYKGSDK